MQSRTDPLPPLKLALHGLNDRSRNTLLMFFEGKGREHGRVVPEHDCEVGIIDLDTLEGKDIWARACKPALRPALLLSVQEQTHPNAIWVRKPLDCDDLIHALHRIRGQLGIALDNGDAAAATSTPTTGTPATGASPVRMQASLSTALAQATPANDTPAPQLQTDDRAEEDASPDRPPPRITSAAVDADDVSYRRAMRTYYGELEDATYHDRLRRDELAYDPEHYLQGALARALRRASRSGTPQALEGLGKLLVVYPDRQQILTDMRDKYLRSLCLQSSRTLQIHLRPIDHAALPTCAEWQDYDAALWKIAFWCARGRIPAGIAPDAPVHLRAWPNFTRLASPPHAMQIIASWSRQPVALIETAVELGVPRRAVFALFSACRALELVDTGTAPLVTRTNPDGPPGHGVPRRLLDTLLKKLG